MQTDVLVNKWVDNQGILRSSKCHQAWNDINESVNRIPGYAKSVD